MVANEAAGGVASQPGTDVRSPGRLEQRLREAPFTSLRDIVAKKPSEGPNLDALDGIRGVAVMIVIASHTHGLALQQHGGVGVWLFFALSAFLLTSAFAARPERASRPPDLARYTRRRVLRIVPLYYAVLLTRALLEGWTGDRLTMHLLFLRADGVYWSIPQELLFYVLLPVLVLLATRLLRGHDLAIAAGLLGLAVAGNLWLTRSVVSLNGNGTSLPFYFGNFASGMAFAYLYRWPPLARRVEGARANLVLHAIGIVALVSLFATAPAWQSAMAELVPALSRLEGPLGWTQPGLFGVLCGALIWITLACPGRLLNRVMSSLVLRAIGLVSFSMYLLHMPVRMQLLQLGVPLGPELFVATTVATYALSSLTYAWIERPFMRMSAARSG